MADTPQFFFGLCRAKRVWYPLCQSLTRRLPPCSFSICKLWESFGHFWTHRSWRVPPQAGPKRAAMGRMATNLKKLHGALGYLEQVRQHLSRLPSIGQVALPGRHVLTARVPTVPPVRFLFPTSGRKRYHFHKKKIQKASLSTISHSPSKGPELLLKRAHCWLTR